MAASTDLAVEVGPRTWIARLRTDRVVIFRASVFKTSNVAASIVAAAALMDSVVIAPVVAEDSAEAIGSAVEDSVAAASAASVVAAGAADGNYLSLECASNFQYNQNLAKLQNL